VCWIDSIYCSIFISMGNAASGSLLSCWADGPNDPKKASASLHFLHARSH
jgi:hypothetical protein